MTHDEIAKRVRRLVPRGVIDVKYEVQLLIDFENVITQIAKEAREEVYDELMKLFNPSTSVPKLFNNADVREIICQHAIRSKLKGE